MHMSGNVCVLHGVSHAPCVCQQKTKNKKNFFGTVLLTPLANLAVPFGAGACTLELCRVIWCGEYRSAVKVSTCNNPSPNKADHG